MVLAKAVTNASTALDIHYLSVHTHLKFHLSIGQEEFALSLGILHVGEVGKFIHQVANLLMSAPKSSIMTAKVCLPQCKVMFLVMPAAPIASVPKKSMIRM